MGYIVVAMLGATFGFTVAALLSASARADAEAELFRVYDLLESYKKQLIQLNETIDLYQITMKNDSDLLKSLMGVEHDALSLDPADKVQNDVDSPVEIR